MSTSSERWYRVTASLQELKFGENNIALVEVNGKNICIARHKTGYFAFTPKCPHAGGNLSEGFIDALGNIVCPVHHYKFSLSNGRNVSGEGYYLKHWSVEVRDNELYVAL